MYQYLQKMLAYLIIVLSFFAFIGIAIGLEYYPASSNWNFNNFCYLSFNQGVNFSGTPHQGVSSEPSLAGYWNMNEGSGTTVADSSGNGNNGTITGASWVDGKYGKALSFDGNDTNVVTVPYSTSLNISNELTITMWLKRNSTLRSEGPLSRHGSTLTYGFYFYTSNDKVTFEMRGLTPDAFTSNTEISPSSGWVFLAATFKANDKAIIYINGVNDKQVTVNGTLNTAANDLLLGYRSHTFNGTIDDARIYNRVLSAKEIAALYVQPDPVSLANYYNYVDPLTNNTLLVYVDSPNANSNNVALVTCTNFFADNRLAFQANNSAMMNVWTSLGQPVFTTGIWNDENYTTTLTLDASSTAELNWNTSNITTYVDAHSGISPSNVTVSYGVSQSFSFNASQGYSFNVAVDGVSQGKINSYTFSNLTASHSINVTSFLLKYTVSAFADLGSTISPSGDVLVNYGGSQLFTIQNITGYNVKHVYVDTVDKGAISNFTFSNVTANHVISVSSESLSTTNSSTPSPSPTTTSTSTPTPSQSPGQTNSPSPTSTSPPETNHFPTQTAAIVAVAIAVLVAVFALAFKKGYITIEAVDEETAEEQNKDRKEGSKEENQDFSI